MPTKTVSASSREAFRCSGEQLDAIVQFAEERRLEDQPFRVVVHEWRRVVALVGSLNLLVQAHRE